MATHDYHEGLDGYHADAVLQDGCGECDARARKGLEGLLDLDHVRLPKLWDLMVATRWGGSTDVHARARSINDALATRQLYAMALLLERSGVYPWCEISEVGATTTRSR